eukprot:TRINITY_DN927_c1_g1_i1.p1 TRINITY_DN927_c1_g1~~TRINITY_DN927_c1_g1_i1.p1  ORF type:complete len:187 (+),score=25.99 TRINITY_DN927_c1_g1_i1:24-584(+)
MGSGSEIVSIINSNSLAEDLQTLELVRDREVKKGFVKRKDPWRRKKKNQVLLEGYVETSEEESREHGSTNGVTRTKSLTDDDLDELKGCLDLGFGFSYEEIPELCNTLPALELCYSMSQRFLDDQQQKSPEASTSAAMSSSETCSSTSASQIANWKISSPGDHPEEVKARLKFWAQAVACTVRLCS